jgi:shikimate dehydrogenase
MALAGLSHITIVNRDAKRGRVLVDLINSKTPAKAELVVWDHDLSCPSIRRLW